MTFTIYYLASNNCAESDITRQIHYAESMLRGVTGILGCTDSLPNVKIRQNWENPHNRIIEEYESEHKKIPGYKVIAVGIYSRPTTSLRITNKDIDAMFNQIGMTRMKLVLS